MPKLVIDLFVITDNILMKQSQLNLSMSVIQKQFITAKILISLVLSRTLELHDELHDRTI